MKAITLLLGFALSGCAHIGHADRLPFFPRVKPAPPGLEQIWLTAAFEGRLVVEGGCVKLRGSRGPARTILWYPGIDLGRDEAGLFVRNSFSGAVTRFGVSAEFGGGSATDDFVRREYRDVARRCGPPYAFGYPET